MNKVLRDKIYEFTKYLNDWETKKVYYVDELLPEILNYKFTNLDKKAKELFLEIRDLTNATEWNNIIDIIVDIKENYEDFLLKEKLKLIEIEVQKRKNIEDLKKNILKVIEDRDLEKALLLIQKHGRDFFVADIEYNTNFYSSLTKKQSIIKTILSRKIQKLVHFTDIRNLESILTNGLLTRENLNKKGITSSVTDIERYDKRLDCTSLSVEYPNYQMMSYKKNGMITRSFCILVFDAQKILLNDSKKYFVYINAANKNASWWLGKEELSESKYFSNMFKENIEYKGKLYTRENIKEPYLPTNPQAEILLNGDILASDIQEIHFETNNNFNIFKTSLKESSMLSKFKFVISDFYFKDREDVEWVER